MESEYDSEAMGIINIRSRERSRVKWSVHRNNEKTILWQQNGRNLNLYSYYVWNYDDFLNSFCGPSYFGYLRRNHFAFVFNQIFICLHIQA